MPEGKKKSRTFRRVSVKVPGGTTTMHYKRRMPAKAKCAGCGTVLAGVARNIPTRIKNLPKTKKRPERPYGGVLCSKCMRKKIIEKAKLE